MPLRLSQSVKRGEVSVNLLRRIKGRKVPLNLIRRSNKNEKSAFQFITKELGRKMYLSAYHPIGTCTEKIASELITMKLTKEKRVETQVPLI